MLNTYLAIGFVIVSSLAFLNKEMLIKDFKEDWLEAVVLFAGACVTYPLIIGALIAEGVQEAYFKWKNK